MILVQLFVSFFKVGLFAIGGAYSFLPLIEREVVQNHKWLERSEFLEVLGIVQVIPGAISIKFASYTGYKVAGVSGAIVANAANLLSPALLILLATVFYSKYRDITPVKAGFEMIQYTVFAMIIGVAIQVVDKSRVFELKYLLVMAASFALFVLAKAHLAFIIIGAGLLGALLG